MASETALELRDGSGHPRARVLPRIWLFRIACRSLFLPTVLSQRSSTVLLRRTKPNVAGVSCGLLRLSWVGVSATATVGGCFFRSPALCHRHCAVRVVRGQAA